MMGVKRLARALVRTYENFTINRFHDIYYNGRAGDPHLFTRTKWMGVPCLKCPLDMWVYQEILSEVMPDLVIETGTHHGGSALFLAHMLDILGKGSIVTIDIANRRRPAHSRIQYVTGSSIDKELVRCTINKYKRDTCLVILDSDHSRKHVLGELALFAEYVSVDSYLIVEDTNINGHPTFPKFGPGPYEAVAEFLEQRDDFALDNTREKFLMTFNPNGFLKRVK